MDRTGLAGEIGIHPLDLAIEYLGAAPIAVTGGGSIALWKDGREVADTVHCAFDFPGGVRFTLEGTLASSIGGASTLFRGRLEHLRIGELLEAIGGALHGAGAPLPLRSHLHQVLGAHNEKEELILYPMTDQSLGPEESDALVARIQASAL